MCAYVYFIFIEFKFQIIGPMRSFKKLLLILLPFILTCLALHWFSLRWVRLSSKLGRRSTCNKMFIHKLSNVMFAEWCSNILVLSGESYQAQRKPT